MGRKVTEGSIEDDDDHLNPDAHRERTVAVVHTRARALRGGLVHVLPLYPTKCACACAFTDGSETFSFPVKHYRLHCIGCNRGHIKTLYHMVPEWSHATRSTHTCIYARSWTERFPSLYQCAPPCTTCTRMPRARLSHYTTQRRTAGT